MKLLSMVVVISMSAWIFVRSSRTLPSSGRGWRILFALALLAGLLLGVRLVTWTYYKSPTLQPYGYPFDYAGAEFFDGQWHRGLISPYLYLAFIADVALGILVFVLPFRVAQWLARRNKNESKLQIG